MELPIFLYNDRILKALLVLFGALYVLFAFLPKHGDYWTIINVSEAFALDPAHFMVGKTWPIVGYPPTFYALQGTWLKLGSYLFHYDLAANSNLTNFTFYSYRQPSFGIFPFWGMVPTLAALFILVATAYKQLNNKWLALICFGPITFVAVGVMGQIDVICALLIFVSLILVQRALRTENSFSLLLLGFLTLGISIEFKTYGGLLLPAYVIYTLALFKDRKTSISKSFVLLGSFLALFIFAMFIVWAPYPGWFNVIILGGPSNFLLQFPPLAVFELLQKISIVPPDGANGISFWPIWLLGYVFILCYMAIRVLRSPRKYLQDGRYFIFFIFTIVAWFFIAVFTHPQWWMFIIPASLLMLDNFENKAATYAFICILIAYPFYPMWWAELPAFFTSYYIPAAIFTVPGSHLGLISAGLADVVLAGSLMFWIYVSKRELNSTVP
ncbi:MAG: glycosyltransferase family 39 protein [Halobacteriota archaeon]